MIYLDNAATTPLQPQVYRVMKEYMRDGWTNPSTLYSTNLLNKIQECREYIAKTINAKPEEIYFTSGGSEANSWAIQGYCNSHKQPHIITSQIEHHSILECFNYYRGEKNYIPVNNDGSVDMDALEMCITDGCLVSIQLVNNEIGTMQDITEIAHLVHLNNGTLHVDAVQAYGHIPIDVEKLGMDMMSVSAHKFGGPKGIGFLYIKNGTIIDPLVFGTQNNHMRGGTYDIASIVGMTEAAKCIQIDEYVTLLRNYMQKQFENIGCKINGAHRGPGILSVTFPAGFIGENFLYLLRERDIYCSAGSACTSDTGLPSHVLKAIGLSDDECGRTLRFSLSNDNTKQDVDFAVATIKYLMELMGII